MIPMTTSSGTRSPRSMISFDFFPSSVPAAIAALSMSPVDNCGSRQSPCRILAWVPLPAPGGPNRIRFIARLFRPGAFESRLLDKTLILLGDEMALNLRNSVHGHADHDQERSAAEGELLHIIGPADDFRDQADRRKIQRTDDRDAGQHVVDIFGRTLSWTDARDE